MTQHEKKEEAVTCAKLDAEIRRLQENAYQLRALVVLCETCYFKMIEQCGPLKHGGTMMADVEDALSPALSLLDRLAKEIEDEIQNFQWLLNDFSRQEEALPGLTDAERAILTKAMVVLRFPDDSSKHLAQHIRHSWGRIDDLRAGKPVEGITRTGGSQ